MQQRTLGPDGARASGRAANLTCHIRGHAVAAVIERCGLGGWSSRPEFLRLKSCQQPSDDIPGSAVTRAVAQNRRPCLVIPGDDIALCVQTRALVHDERESVILPRHFIFSRKLYAHGLA